MKKGLLKEENYKLCNIDQVKVDEILDKYPSNRKASAVILIMFKKNRMVGCQCQKLKE